MTRLNFLKLTLRMKQYTQLLQKNNLLYSQVLERIWKRNSDEPNTFRQQTW